MNRFHSYIRRSPLVLTVLLGTAGCVFTGQPDPANRPVASDRVMAFDALYRQNCAGCHGTDGKMGPAPPLNDPLFRAIVPVETVEEVVAAGRHGTLMPAFSREHGGPLTSAQVAVLANEIKGMRYKVVGEQEEDSARIQVVRDAEGAASAWGDPGVAPPGAPPYIAPKGAAGDASAGRDRFAAACASCHGDHGQGTPKAGRPTLAIHSPAFLGLISDQVVRRIVITGRADLGMPGYANHGKEALTSEDVTNLVALLSYWRQGRSIGDDGKPRVKPNESQQPRHSRTREP